ncbi:multidrug-resistance like protein 1 isoform i [Anaeramoeba ignava]|uniref:Multidrug-resistance like protein 1 isoform i n=1 Tax=Anaeramoeba ignava TaxID=1746090 RepID=A0A9Q0LSH5_ANAIG|nr:multidrug-resistance like protein 1 isoform i [Anaeramoeba ignava]
MEKNEELKANIFSRLTFSWFTKLINLSSKKQLQEKDLFKIRPQDNSTFLSSKLELVWNSLKPNQNLWKCIRKFYGKSFLISGIPRLMYDTTVLLIPILLQQVIRYFETRKMKDSQAITYITLLFVVSVLGTFSLNIYSDLIIKVGYRVRQGLSCLVYRKLLLLNPKVASQKKQNEEIEKNPKSSSSSSSSNIKNDSQIVMSEEILEEDQFFDIEFDIKSGQFLQRNKNKEKSKKKKEKKKKTKKKNKDKSKKGIDSSPNPLNIITNDVSKIQEAIFSLHLFWSTLIQIIVSVIFLSKILGWSALIGLSLVLISIPINSLFMKKLIKISGSILQQADSRIKFINELIQGIRTLKLYGWEKYFKNKITNVRKKELKFLKSNLLWSALYRLLWDTLPLTSTLVSFVVYSLAGNKLTAEKIFTSIAWFSILQSQLSMLPMLVILLANYRVSFKRIEVFLLQQEIPKEIIDRNIQRISSGNESIVKIINGNFSWKNNQKSAQEMNTGQWIPLDPFPQEKQTSTLFNINATIKSHELTMIVGPVGSGKSSFLSAILGEIPRNSGSVFVSGSIAFVPQTPWILNGTLKENIIFTSELDEERYRKTLEMCDLIEDLKALPVKDLTEIGEKGVNISGGQKQRISLARAVYQNSDIYLMDDPLSSVDVHVGAHLFNNAILGNFLQNKTRILVTNQLQFLPYSDYIIVLNQGTIVQQGKYSELISNGFDFSKLIEVENQNDENNQNQNNENNQNNQNNQNQNLSELLSSDSDNLFQTITISENDQSKKDSLVIDSEWEEITKKNFNSKELIDDKNNFLLEKEKLEKQKDYELIQEEKREIGKVKWKYYRYYIKSAGGCYLIFWLLSALILTQGFTVSSSYWLAIWSDGKLFQGKSKNFYILVYLLIGFCVLLFTFSGLVIALFGSIKASRKIHTKLLENISKAPIKFFDKTPTGRIINRFSKDIMDLDLSISSFFTYFITQILVLISIFAIIVSVTYYFLIPLVFIFLIYYRILMRFRKTSREIRRIQSISMSPVYNNFSETLDGLSSIRAYMAQNHFIQRNDQRLNSNIQATYNDYMSQRWLSIRIELISSFIVLLVSFLVFFNRNSIKPTYAALSITYCLQISSSLNWIIKYGALLEQYMNSIERIAEFSQIESEQSSLDNSKILVSSDWPQYGKILFENVSMKYRPNLPDVLKDISVEFESGEKVGIVGRTGCGKTSLALCLFRIVNPYKGSILIDGIDISKIKISKLRHKLSIIPQDVIIFSGTVRENLDPFKKYTDLQIWEILSLVNLTEKIRTLPFQLSTEISEENSYFSTGEKQLICLARILLKNSKIILLDEATAFIDQETDKIIQQRIKSHFKNSTVITIAHRLNTILDSNRILCLKKGQVVEFDTPDNLLKNRDGLFSEFVEEDHLIQSNKI